MIPPTPPSLGLPVNEAPGCLDPWPCGASWPVREVGDHGPPAHGLLDVGLHLPHRLPYRRAAVRRPPEQCESKMALPEGLYFINCIETHLTFNLMLSRNCANA